jgi:RNA polymerase sigma factor for flagellar operon FliA
VQRPTQTYGTRNPQQQRQELILAHLPLVRHIIGRLQAKLPRGVDVENLEAAGVLGLVEAANRFDPDHGNRFDTFAYLRIRGAVLDELRRNSPLPQHLLERISVVRAAYRNLSPPVTVDQLALATGLTIEDVSECLAALPLTRVVSWEDVVGPPELQCAPTTARPDRQVEAAEQKQLLAQAIAQLPESERLVVTLYYLEDLRLKEIGAVLSVSESRVSRILKTAIFNLGEYMRARDGA